MNTSNALSYRPRNAGHDYYGCGTYLITLVVSGREQLLSHFVTDLGRKTTLALTPLGEAVQEAWLQTPAHSLTHGNKVVVHACVCMPDHFTALSKCWSPCSGAWVMSSRPSRLPAPVGGSSNRASHPPAWLREKAALHSDDGTLIRSIIAELLNRK